MIKKIKSKKAKKLSFKWTAKRANAVISAMLFTVLYDYFSKHLSITKRKQHKKRKITKPKLKLVKIKNSR